MAKKKKKPTNKAKFSLYLDKTLMELVSDHATEEQRSVNFMVEKALNEKYL